MNEMLMQLAQPVINIIVVAIAGFAMNALKNYFNANSANQWVNFGRSVVYAAVEAVNQTLVDDKRVSGFSLSSEVASMAKRVAVIKSKDALSKQAIRQITKVSGMEIDTWLGDQIEAAVQVSKTIKRPLSL